MPGEFFENRELERELVDDFPTPLADVFDDLTYERAPRGRLAKLLDLFRVATRLLAFYALAASANEELPPQALERLRKLLRQRLSEGDWIGLAREIVRPFARTPAPFPLAEVAAVFFKPGTDQPGPGAAALERLLKIRNEWAHGASGTEAEVEAIIEECRPDLESLVGLLRFLGKAPWFLAEGASTPGRGGSGLEAEGRLLVGTTPRRGFRTVTQAVEGPVEAGVIYALGPVAPLRLGPLVQWLVAPPGEGEAEEKRGRGGEGDPELFLLESGGRREAKLQAFPSGHEVGNGAAQEWLVERAALPQETQERGPRFDDVPMIDRRSECEEFRRLLRRVSEERHGQVLVIEGEAGIGKTKFARFCREAVVAQAVRVMHGAYRDHAGGAYAGIREALEELFGAEMLEREATAERIAERLPELGYGDNPSEAEDLTAFLTQFLRPIPGVGEGGREGLDYVVGRIERFLRRASLHVSLLLMLEDLHWADAESLALLQHLAAVLDTDPTRLLIIASMRAGDREPNPALEAALQKMARFEGTFYRRRFARLGEDDTATLIEESLQADFEDKAAVYQLAEGNPLHVLSILRYLHSEELLETSGTGWRVKQGVQLAEVLPPTVREVLKLRVQRLVAQHEEGPARRETLFWAAVAGRRFDAEVLAEAIREGAPHLTARLDSHLDALLEAGILDECRSLPGDVLAFDHQLLREVVLADQEGPRAERARHRHLAAAKVRRVERGDRSLLPEVAHHYLEAREWAEAVRYHKLAGDAARDSLAFREAASLYESAARLLKEQPGLELPDEERASLFEAQADALQTLGQMDEALAVYREAQAYMKQDLVRWARTERIVAWLHSRKGRLDEAAEACERARKVLDPVAAAADLADVLRTLGVIEILRSHGDAALTHLQSALAIYQQGEPSEGLARCYDYLAYLHQNRGELEAMLDATQRSREICEALGDPVSVGRALNNVAYVLILLGRDEEALPLLIRVAEIFERHHIEKDLPNVYHSLAEALLKSNRGTDARPYLERGLESARRVGEVRTVADFHRLLARQEAAAGHATEAEAQFEEALRICSETDLESLQAQIRGEFEEFRRQSGKPE